MGIGKIAAIILTGAKIFQASTSEVYGDPKISPQSEDYLGNVNPIGIRSCYDEGKRAAETLFFDYKRQHNLDIRVVRIFNTYGPRMHPNDAVSSAISSFKRYLAKTSRFMAMAARPAVFVMWMI